MKFLILYAFLCSTALASTEAFPAGKKPPISMKEAFEFFEVHGEKFSNIPFNPNSADLSSAGWRFHQTDEESNKYEYIYYFKNDLCLLIKYPADGQQVRVAFNKKGKEIELPENRVVPAEEKDPFK